MVCTTRMSLIGPPITHVYAVFFILGCLVASIGNVLALIILWLPSQRSRSNKILTSLAVSDLLVGFIVFPITGYQVLNHQDLRNCAVDFTRVYFSVFLEGASVLTLAVVAFDRYILMTKMMSYGKKSTRIASVILIICSWLFPALAPLLRWVSKASYLVVVITIFVGPFFILFISYFLIAKQVRHLELTLKQYQQKSPDIKLSTDHLNKSDHASLDKTVFTDGSSSSSKVDIKFKSQKGHLKVAKSVTFLLITYFVCVTPINTWLILNLINSYYQFISPEADQNLYLFAMVAISYNSCFNPMIYFFKNPEMRKGLRKLLRNI